MKRDPSQYDEKLCHILSKRAPKTTGRSKWTAEENKRFDEAVLLFNKNWVKINEMVTTKTLR